ncbi:MAG: hypothetical protein ABW125_21570, partial [Candidatus Thiodiazotropha lotti]
LSRTVQYLHTHLRAARTQNSKGRLFRSGTTYGAKLGYEMGEHQQGRAMLILDKALPDYHPTYVTNQRL